MLKVEEENHCIDCENKITAHAKRCKSCSQIGKRMSKEARKKMSIARKGKKLSKEHKRRLSEGKKNNKNALGSVRSLEYRRKMSIVKGGDGNINRLSKKRRTIPEDVKWRKQIFKRDNYTCQMCNKRGTTLNAHHIYPKALYPKLRFKLSNGITLCKECHDDTKRLEMQWVSYFQMVHKLAI